MEEVVVYVIVLVWAAVTEHYRLGHLNNKHLFLWSLLEFWSLEV